MTLRMGDSVTVANIPAGLDAVAGYVGGRWPTYPTVVATFPAAHHLSIAVNAGEKADCLDVEAGDASPGQIPGWLTGWTIGNTSLPVIYTSAGNIQAVISAAGWPRTKYLIWSAHYDWPQKPGTAHICGPATCGYLQADATQWTDHGGVWDETLLFDNFFDDPPIGGDVPLTPADIQAVTASVVAALNQPFTLIEYGDSKDAAQGKVVQGHPFNLYQMWEQLNALKAQIAAIPSGPPGPQGPQGQPGVSGAPAKGSTASVTFD